MEIEEGGCSLALIFGALFLFVGAFFIRAIKEDGEPASQNDNIEMEIGSYTAACDSMILDMDNYVIDEE